MLPALRWHRQAYRLSGPLQCRRHIASGTKAVLSRTDSIQQDESAAQGRSLGTGLIVSADGLPQINHYGASSPPTEEQANVAKHFFTKQPPLKLFSSPIFRLLPQSNLPEVTFLGRSNVGKSSLINTLFGREIAYTSKKPGKTRLLNAYGVTPQPLVDAKKGDEQWKRMKSGLLLVDLPGYGYASRSGWGEEISKYLRQRRQLRRAFMLVDSEHGLKSTDKAMLEALARDGVPHSLVLSKVDKLIGANYNVTNERLINRMQKAHDRVEQVRSEVGRLAGDVLCVSSAQKLGIDGLRHAVLSACSLAGEGMNIADIQILDSPS